jgi:hypothetical protein
MGNEPWNLYFTLQNTPPPRYGSQSDDGLSIVVSSTVAVTVRSQSAARAHEALRKALQCQLEPTFSLVGGYTVVVEGSTWRLKKLYLTHDPPGHEAPVDFHFKLSQARNNGQRKVIYLIPDSANLITLTWAFERTNGSDRGAGPSQMTHAQVGFEIYRKGHLHYPTSNDEGEEESHSGTDGRPQLPSPRGVLGPSVAQSSGAWQSAPHGRGPKLGEHFRATDDCIPDQRDVGGEDAVLREFDSPSNYPTLLEQPHSPAAKQALPGRHTYPPTDDLASRIASLESRVDQLDKIARSKLSPMIEELRGKLEKLRSFEDRLATLEDTHTTWNSWRNADSGEIQALRNEVVDFADKVGRLEASSAVDRAKLLRVLTEVLRQELVGSSTHSATSPSGPAAQFEALLGALRDSSLPNAGDYIKKLRPEGVYPVEGASAQPETLRGLLLAILRQEEQARPADIDWTTKHPILHELSGEFVKTAAQAEHRATFNALEAMLASLDIKMSFPKPGDEFDRTYHRSVGREPTPHLDRSQVAVVDRPAFLKGGRTLLLAYVRTG